MPDGDTFLGWVCTNDPDYQVLERLHPITGTFVNPLASPLWLGAVYRVPTSQARAAQATISQDFKIPMAAFTEQKEAEDWVRRTLQFSNMGPPPASTTAVPSKV